MNVEDMTVEDMEDLLREDVEDKVKEELHDKIDAKKDQVLELLKEVRTVSRVEY